MKAMSSILSVFSFLSESFIGEAASPARLYGGGVANNVQRMHVPQPMLRTVQQTHKDINKKTFFEKISGKSSMREKIMGNIIETEKNRLMRLQEIATLRAQVEYDRIYRDEMAMLYSEIGKAEKGLQDLQTALITCDDPDQAMRLLHTASTDADMALLNYLDSKSQELKTA